MTLLHARWGQRAAARVQRELLDRIKVEWVDRDLHSRALDACLARRSRRVSVVDQVSFEFMR